MWDWQRREKRMTGQISWRLDGRQRDQELKIETNCGHSGSSLSTLSYPAPYWHEV